MVKYFGEQVDRFRDVLDGSNLEACFMELGLRFHRAIVEHIYQFQYNSTGFLSFFCFGLSCERRSFFVIIEIVIFEINLLNNIII